MSIEFPSLIIDASSTRIQLGILSNDEWLILLDSEKEALESIFNLAQKALAECDLQIKDLRSIVFCEGPGSILSLRLSVMAIHGWSSFPAHGDLPLYTYKSLPCAAVVLASQIQDDNLFIVSDFRKGTWTCYNHGERAEISVISNEELKQLDKSQTYYLPQRKQWSLPPEGIEKLDYRIEALKSPDVRKALLRKVEQAAVFVAEEPEFARWDNKRHS